MTRKPNSHKVLNNPKSSGYALDRREALRATGAAVLAASAFPLGWMDAAEKKKQKVLYFSRSAGFESGTTTLPDCAGTDCTKHPDRRLALTFDLSEARW